jgi:hypothetical protein
MPRPAGAACAAAAALWLALAALAPAPPLDANKAFETFLNLAVDLLGPSDAPTLEVSVWDAEARRTVPAQLPTFTASPNNLFGLGLEAVCAQQPYYYQEAGARGSKPYEAEDRALKALVGQGLVARWRPFPTGARGGQRSQAAQFSPLGLRAFWAALYRGPARFNLQGRPAQRFYDILLKHYVRGLAQISADVLANPAAFRAACAEYERLAFDEQAPDFEGVEFVAQHYERILPAATRQRYDQLAEAFYAQAPSPLRPGAAHAYAETWCGVLMRRHIDGTLPTLLELMRTLLQDYDPEAHAQYAPRLQWNG